ncbi:MAG: sulfur carrier protein ThiS [Xanthomonadaceae bacterium]|jgi:sulfur carrier protein|nr:sulfur carrier protein ThiS [Xanthomonadaceae bacterium]
MNIVLNGEQREIGDDCTIAELLNLQGLTQRRVAIEVDGEIVPRGMHAQRQLRQGERVEIVQALGGG